MEFNPERTRKIQLAELELIKVFVNICERQKLTYYMSGGTMLGAVRHKGYIPWDDDADFMMPREDYEKFLLVAEEYLKHEKSGKEYALDNSYKNPSARITSSELQVYITSSIRPRTENVWIDIFPLDGAPSNVLLRRIHGVRLLVLRALFMLSVFEDWVQVNKQNRPFHERAIISLAKHIPLQKLLSFQKRKRALEHALKKYPCEESEIWLNFTGGYKLHEMFARSVFGKGTLYDFEGMKLVGVDDYDTYLTGVYGDYMTPPSAEERHGHSVNV